MPFFVETTYRAGAQDLREQHRPAHRAYLERMKAIILASGALLDDSGEQASGGVFLLDVAMRQEADAFVAGDPFRAAGLIQQSRIVRWNKGYFDRRAASA
jgi:uncharacterized protein YciI